MYIKTILLIPFLLLFSYGLIAQTPTVQDCEGAIPVCQNIYSETNSYSGEGNFPNEINDLISCLDGEINNVWYTFTTQSAGNICFDITPNDLNDDYDWAVYDISNNPCSDIATNAGIETSCNFDPDPGITGANGAFGDQNEPCFPVVPGQTLVLTVQNYSGSVNGYTLDFSSSTATIFDNVPPSVNNVLLPIYCGSTTVTFNFSESILCNSIELQDFQFIGPGVPYALSNLTGINCSNGGTQENEFSIDISPPLTISGAYQLCLIPGSGFVEDLCGNIAAAGCWNFNITNLNLASSSTINLCDDGTGQATFNLTSINNTINSGTTNTVTWFTDPATTTTVNNPSTFLSGPTTVYASVSDGTCSDTASVYLVIDPLPTAIDQTPATLCEDIAGSGTVSNIDLTALNTAIDGGTSTTISWFSDPTASNAIVNPSAATVTNNQIFYALITNGNCFDTATVTYTVIALPDANAGLDDTSCTLTYNLNATPSLGIGSWSGPAGINFGNTASPTSLISATTPGTYQLIWTEDNGNGCIDADTVNITLLTPIATSVIEDCTNNSATITITNGLPEIDGSLYTASNLLPATANFVNTTATHNGTITINGLLNGNTYSFDIIDGNGCTATFNGGPYVSRPASNAGVDDTSCTLTYNLNATPSSGIGSWSGPAGITFGNTTSPTSSVSTATAGTYQLIWTENNGGCIRADTINITFNILSVPNTPTNPTCFGSTNGQIILAPQSNGGATTHSYQWDAAANNQITNPATNLTAGAFTVRVTDGFGCFVDSTFTLTQPQDFTFTTDSSNSNCGLPDGWATVVNFAGGAGPYTYDWGTGPTTNDSLLNLIPGVYTVTVTDAVLPVGCDTTFSITVGNNPPWSASITNPVNVSCNGFTDGTATANGSDPLVAYTYLWDAAAKNQTTQTATNLGAGSYLVTVTDPNTGCTDTTSVTITQPTMVTITANPVNICLGQTANLTATGANGNGAPYSYDWDNGAFIGSPYSVTPGVTTTYAVFTTDVDGCPSLPINVDVIVSQPLTVTVDLDQTICFGESTSFSASTTPGSGNGGPYTYSWDNGLPNGANQNISPIVTTTYTVTLDDGCTTPVATAQITVTVNPLPVVDFTVDDQNACEGTNQLFTFNNVPGATDSILTWSFGDGPNVTGLGANFNPSVDTVTHIYPVTSGVYDVTLTVTTTSPSGQCSNSLTKPGYITIFENPVADFTMDPNPTTMFDPTINFYDASTTNALNINSWAWNIAGLDSSSLQNPSHTFPQDTGNYLVTLTIVDDNGCSDSVTYTAIVKGEFAVFIPNSFTPNGDGLNDEFFPKGYGFGKDNFSFFIFNRWGELLYESHSKLAPWNGNFKGENVPNGTYVWRLEFNGINGILHKEVGKVNLIR